MGSPSPRPIRLPIAVKSKFRYHFTVYQEEGPLNKKCGQGEINEIYSFDYPQSLDCTHL